MQSDPFRRVLLIALFLFFVPVVFGQVQAATIKAAGVKGAGAFSNSASLLVDGNMPAQASTFDGPACVYWSEPDVSFIIDLGAVYQITGITLQADNNDDYLLEASKDGQNFTSILVLKSGIGEVDWGMETVSTEKSNRQYLQGLQFNPTAARYIRVSASEGDQLYSVSEVAVTGTTPVPAVR